MDFYFHKTATDFMGNGLSDRCWNGGHRQCQGWQDDKRLDGDLCECLCHGETVKRVPKAKPETLPLPDVGFIEIS